MSKVVVIGSSNTDMVVTSRKMPLPGETVIGSTFNVIQGGKGANQAVAAARAQGDVAFVAKVGDDDLGAKALEGYKRDGIDTSAIFRDSENPTGVALIIVEEGSGQNSIVVVPGANGNLSKKEIEVAKPLITEASVVLIQLEIPLEVVEYVLKICKEAEVITILNPAPALKLSDELLGMVDIITPNETETALLTDCSIDTLDDIKKAADVLLQKINDTVIVTLGDKGVYYKSKSNGEDLLPAKKVKAVDTTAAGDVFNGYLATSLSENTNLKTAIQHAIKAASISVTRKGAQPSIPTLTECNYENN